MYGRDTSACWHADTRRAKEMRARKEFADLVMREAAPAASAQIFRACMSRDQSSADAPTGILGPGQTLLISYRALAE